MWNAYGRPWLVAPFSRFGRRQFSGSSTLGADNARLTNEVLEFQDARIPTAFEFECYSGSGVGAIHAA